MDEIVGRCQMVIEAIFESLEAKNKLLKLIEGTVASVPPQGGRKHPQQEFLQVNTANILFICGGAFAGLDAIIRERTEKGGIGFGAEVKSKIDREKDPSLLHDVEPGDHRGVLVAAQVFPFKDALDNYKELDAKVRDYVRQNAEKLHRELERMERER